MEIVKDKQNIFSFDVNSFLIFASRSITIENSAPSGRDTRLFGSDPIALC